MIKEIAKGDEVTVFYGKVYFGKNHELCLCPHKEKHVTKDFNLLLKNVSSGSKTRSGLKRAIDSSTAPNIENIENILTPTISLTSTLTSTDDESVSTNHLNFITADVLLECSAVRFIVSVAPEVSAKKQKTCVQTMVPIDEDQSMSEQSAKDQNAASEDALCGMGVGLVSSQRFSRKVKEQLEACNVLEPTNVILDCEFCSLTLKTSMNFVSHLRNHKLEALFTCPFCKRIFGIYPHYIEHMKNHFFDMISKGFEFLLSSKNKKKVKLTMLSQHRKVLI